MEDRPEKQISPENIETPLSQAQDNNPLPGENENDPENDKKFPGYPHYPAQDDLLNPANSTGRVDVDMDAMDTEDKTI